MAKALFISDFLFKRNHIDTGAWENENEKFVIISTIEINTKEIVKVQKASKLKAFMHSCIEHAFTRVSQHKSVSFKTRIRRQNLKIREDLKKRKISGKLLATIIKWAIVRVLSVNSCVLKVIKSEFAKHLYCPTIAEILKSKNIDVVYMPSSVISVESDRMISTCQKNGIKVYTCVDNWDNISSKSIALAKPDAYFVWSKQQSLEIRRLYGDVPVKIVGSSRFDVYKKAQIKTEAKYILFVGSAMKYDEQAPLKITNNFLERESKLGQIVLYRPHPWQRHFDNVDISVLKTTQVDPRLDEHFASQIYSSSYQPNLNDYPQLLNEASVVIGMASTFMLESLLMGKKYILLAYEEDTSTSIDDPFSILCGYEHLRDVERLENVYVCRRLDQLESILEQLLIHNEEQSYDNETIKLEYFIHFNENKSFLDGVLAES